MCPTSNCKPRGFTVIELLVALAVVVVLAALIFPYFSKKREDARSVSCQSNLKQLGLGFMQYCRDYDENFPLSTTGQVVSTGILGYAIRVNGWADAVQPYVKSLKTLQCPSDPTGAKTNPTSTGFSDYFYNCALSWNGQLNPKKVNWNSKVSLSRFLSPDHTILLGDAGVANGIANGTGTASTGTAFIGTTSIGTARTRSNGYSSSGALDVRSPSLIAPRNGTVANDGFAGAGQRHSGGINLCFADGHVKWYPSNGANKSNLIYNFNSSFAVSGTNPTFNVVRP